MEQHLLTDAAFQGDLNTVKQLIEQGYDVNLEHHGVVNRTPLDNAIENEQLEVIRYLLENGAEINRKSEFGTPLFHALDIETDQFDWFDEQGNPKFPAPEVTAILIEFGADVNFKGDDVETPLDCAIRMRHKNAEKILREHGAKTSK